MTEAIENMGEIKNALDTLSQFMPKGERFALVAGLSTDESEYFAAKILEMAERVRTMPATYGQDGKGERAIAYLHYFAGGMDWFITEKDVEPDQLQAFGLADLGEGFPELGYISIQELTAHGVELDLHFAPKTLAEIKASRSA